MLVYIDVEHEIVLEDPMRREKHLVLRMQEKLRFEQLSGLPCLTLRFEFVDDGWLDTIDLAGVLISGAQTDWSLYDRHAFDRLYDFIRTYPGPLIGFCGGHQLIAHAFGAMTGPIRPLRPEESDPRPDYGAGLFKELGVHQVELLGDDPLFAGLPATLQVVEDHYWEVKELPADFVWLAKTKASPIQAFRHRDRPIYGTQFHPERYDERQPLGQQLLRNFFQLVASSNIR